MVDSKSMGKQGSLGQWLRDRRRKEGLSLRKAAEKTELSHGTIADIERGVRSSPGTIRKLAQAFADDANQKLALEDQLLVLAGHRTARAEGEEPSEPRARLMDKIGQLSEPQIEIMVHFANFLIAQQKASP